MIVERFFQALQNLTKREFLALFVQKLRTYKGNPQRDKGRVAEIFYLLPNMLAPPSEIVVSHEIYVKQI